MSAGPAFALRPIPQRLRLRCATRAILRTSRDGEPVSEQTLQIAGMTCAACQHHVERALRSVPGVESANVNLMAHTAHVVADEPVGTQSLIAAVRQAGYDASLPSSTTDKAKANEADHLDGHSASDASLGVRVIVSLIAGAVAMILSMPLMMNSSSSDPLLNAAARAMAPLMPGFLMQLPVQPVRWFLCLLSLAMMSLAAPEIYMAAWRAAKHRATNMNTLIAIGTLSAFAMSLMTVFRGDRAADVYFESVILILAFLMAGRWLEARARRHATGAIRGFAELTASTARLVEVDPASESPDYGSAPETVLPLDAIQAGDLVRIVPGDRIPLDGIIVDGRSSVDESMLTGEPLPVTRTRGDRATAGALNLDGVLVVRATAVGAASTLAQMQRLLEEAQSTRAPMQRLADRVSAIFVPSILVLAAVTFAVWSIAMNTRGHHEGFGQAIAVAIAVLIIACPCAMGLAVPAAVTVALGRAAQAGLLIKGGEALERISRLDTLALDKTGTLTEGRPEIVHFELAPEATWDRGRLIESAAAVEQSSTHPLAQAVVAFASAQGAMSGNVAVKNLQVLPGTGIRATVDDHEFAIANASLLPTSSPERTPGSASQLGYATPLYVLVDGRVQATFFATDRLRPEAATAVGELQELKIRSVMLTGDTKPSAERIAKEAGISDVRAALLPEGKLEAIRELQAKRLRVGMAGDGINDAASLAQSDAGFAMAAGTDLAREAGDVLLLHSDLRLLPAAIRLSRQTVAVMRQNLGWAFAYNIIGLPIAAGALYPHFHILLSPVLAGAAMALSSVSVLINSLRLRGARLGPA